MVAMPKGLEPIREYFIDKPSPFVNAKTIQILMIRQVLDFSIFRTEDSRELNTVELPRSKNDTTREVYGLFLASKQKAVETRRFMELLKTVEDYSCYLPMNLCMKCPRCILFGSVKPKGAKYNIKHRIEYSSAFSLAPFDEINEIITFNAINEANQKTGQALNITHNFKPLTIFPSIITLKAVSWKEFIMVLKTLLSAHSYGAETRVKGDVRNEIISIIGGYEEIITSLELTLELRELLNEEIKKEKVISEEEIIKNISTILESYKKISSSPSNVKILSNEGVKTVLDAVRTLELNKDFVDSVQKDVETFISEAES